MSGLQKSDLAQPATRLYRRPCMTRYYAFGFLFTGHQVRAEATR